MGRNYLSSLCSAALGFALGTTTMVCINEYHATERRRLDAEDRALHVLYKEDIKEYKKTIEELRQQLSEKSRSTQSSSLDDKFK